MSVKLKSRSEVEAELASQPEPDLTDPDNPEWTQEDFAKAKRVEDLPPDHRDAILKAFPNTRLRGAQKSPTKVRTTIRLSPQVRAYFQQLGRDQGRPWQTLVNDRLLEIIKTEV